MEQDIQLDLSVVLPGVEDGDACLDRLESALKVALKDPTLKQRFADLGTEPVADSLATPEALQAHLKAQTAVWAPIIKKAGAFAD